MAYNLEKISVLIVDDSPHIRQLLRGILFAFGCKTVKEAPDVKTALSILLTSNVDILICDWNMEPMSGIELVKKIRNGENFPNPFLPIVMLTGHTRHERVIEARDAGVDEFIAKPISAQNIYDHIKNIIDNPRPYVRSPTYFGPDRRRKQIPFEGEERRIAKPDFTKIPEKKKLTTEQIKSLTNTNIADKKE